MIRPPYCNTATPILSFEYGSCKELIIYYIEFEILPFLVKVSNLEVLCPDPRNAIEQGT